jgi:lysophospholipase L1-like esterase
MFLLVAGELVMSRLLFNGYYVWPPNFHKTFEVRPDIIAGVSTPSELTISADGFRGDPLSGEAGYRILAIGGSTTICVYLDDSKAWPYLVQQKLNEMLGPKSVWVGNAGRPGHSTPSHILQVEKLLAQHPEIDAVILLVGVNDALIALEATIDKPLVFNTAENVALRMAFSVFPDWDSEAPWYTRNVIGRLLRIRSWNPIPLKKDGVFSMDAKGEFYSVVRGYRKAASVYRAEVPDLSAAIAIYVSNLDAIVDRAEALERRVIFATQPTVWRDGMTQAEQDLLWAGGTDFFHLKRGKPYYSPGALADAMALYNTALLDVCQRRGVECVEMAEMIPRTFEEFYDDAHFTERGSDRVAAGLAEYLAATEPLGGH